MGQRADRLELEVIRLRAALARSRDDLLLITKALSARDGDPPPWAVQIAQDVAKIHESMAVVVRDPSPPAYEPGLAEALETLRAELRDRDEQMDDATHRRDGALLRLDAADHLVRRLFAAVHDLAEPSGEIYADVLHDAALYLDGRGAHACDATRALDALLEAVIQDGRVCVTEWRPWLTLVREWSRRRSLG